MVHATSASVAEADAIRKKLHPVRRGVRYALRIFVGVIVLWEIAAALGDYSPIWATVSLVMTSEIEMRLSFFASTRRFAHMAIGCAIALFVLLWTRPNLWEFAAATTVASLISFFVLHIGGNWRAAAAATAIVLGAGFDTFTRNAGMHEALIRTAEVLGGCLIALVIAWVANKVWAVGEEIIDPGT
jgi:uncharacterized membrane protein YccC